MHADIFTKDTDIHDYLKQHQEKDLLRLFTAGSVDDGKSTMIGRLMADSRAVYDDQIAAIQRDSAKNGSAGGEIDWSLLLDGLKAEREQGITIDVAYRYFTTARRKFIIADTPGHEQYTRNMVTGASTADLGIMLIDAKNGVTTQTRRHAFILSLLGIRHVVVAINKMDLVGYNETRFDEIRRAFIEFAARLDLADVHFIPMAAVHGENVVRGSRENMPWYEGPTLLGHLESVHIASDQNFVDARFPVQMVIRPDHTFRGYAGTMASGILRSGDEVIALPSKKRSRITKIVTADGELDEAFPPLAVVVTLADEIDVSRGNMLVRPGNVPTVTRDIEAMLVWMDEEPLHRDRDYFIKHTTASTTAHVADVRYRVDVNTLNRHDAKTLRLNDIGRVSLALMQPLAVDAYQKNKATGAFILIDRETHNTVAAGMVLDRQQAKTADVQATTHKSSVTTADREKRLGHRGVVVWLTGLPKSGKSAIAFALEKHLFDLGALPHVLDSSNLRHGLNRDLDFSSDDRRENIRRLAAVARLSADAGLLTIVASISPFADDRLAARDTIGPDRFFEVFIDTPLDECEKRDAVGRYARARAGELPYFPGITSPYEAPANPALTLPTAELSIEASVGCIVKLLIDHMILRGPESNK